MLYLEDYLEMIEHLPQELRDRFTEMRELDLSVQNNMDNLEKQVKLLFSECKRNNNESCAVSDAQFQTIRNEYYKTLEDADEKVHLGNATYDLVDKYLRRLDTELHKFKCELEADNKGITELLEKRSLELDTPIPATSLSSQKENRYERYRPRTEKRRDSSTAITIYPEKRQCIATTIPVVAEPRHSVTNSNSNVPVAIPQSNTSTTAAPAYNLSHIGAGPAIAAAASQAIAATQQMQQGRRTASLKASYEAINTGLNVHDLAIGRELAGAAQTAIQAIQQDTKKKQKRLTTSTSTGVVQQQQQQVAPTPAVVAPAPESPTVDIANQEVTDGEWTYDPNEPRYCLCNQVSYGDMVACDNEDCPSEWFHYPCVGITAPPKGKWYCPQCTASMRRRGGRKN